MASPLIVMVVAGLSENLLSSGHCPRLAAFVDASLKRRVKPCLPALTLPAQATYITGQPPGRHGIVGNGFYDRAYREHRFWTASAGLLDQPPFWAGKPMKTGVLFWWHCLGAGADLYMNVAPIHTPDGKTLSSCYSDPPGLYPELEASLGPFPLHRFWGPGISIESSKWILDATEAVADRYDLDLLLTYIPHMDYSLQRSGPGSEETSIHLKELDDLLAGFLERSGVVLLSEYGISPVNGAVRLNRTLLEAGLFRVRTVQGREYPDLAGSRAFALCDHQVAHVYLSDPADRDRVGALLSSTRGVDQVIHDFGHPRAGELVVLSEPDQWFHYTWWDDEGVAPAYASTVDIHNKIGYDPLELIFDPAGGTIASDPGLIKGSHGLIPQSEEYLPLLITPAGNEDISVRDTEISATDVQEVLLKLLATR